MHMLMCGASNNWVEMNQNGRVKKNIERGWLETYLAMPNWITECVGITGLWTWSSFFPDEEIKISNDTRIILRCPVSSVRTLTLPYERFIDSHNCWNNEARFHISSKSHLWVPTFTHKKAQNNKKASPNFLSSSTNLRRKKREQIERFCSSSKNA